MLAKNIVFLLRKITVFVFFEACLVGVFELFFSQNILFSVLLGMVFSFIVFFQFTSAQTVMLRKQNKGLFFSMYVLRLVLYAVPICFCLLYKNYFNFYVVLLFLFTYQIHFICFEFFRSLKKYKRQKLYGWFS